MFLSKRVMDGDRCRFQPLIFQGGSPTQPDSFIMSEISLPCKCSRFAKSGFQQVPFETFSSITIHTLPATNTKKATEN